MGTVVKTVTANTSVGQRMVTVKVNIPPPAGPAPMTVAERQRNALIAAADRQAVFKNGCADCHLKSALGKMGVDLYAASCGVCHESPHRASTVPDLHALKKPGDIAYWQNWIANGRTNSLMPAFALSQGGPLTDAQISSLAELLNRTISQRFSTNSVIGSGSK
jgi:cytochrome c553